MAGSTPSPAVAVAHTVGRRPPNWPRRARSVPAVVVGFVVGAPLALLALPLLAVADLVRGRSALPTVRVTLFVVWYLLWEVTAVVAASVLWITSGFGRRIGTERSEAAHARLQASWVRSILHRARQLLRLDLEVTGADCLGTAGGGDHTAGQKGTAGQNGTPGGGPLILLCRHASMVDTLVPASLLFERGYRVRYVLKDELLWDPALDIIGHRLPNCFVKRDSDDMAAELDAVGRLAAGAGPGDALVIFPEGTRWSPAKRLAAVERLERTHPERADRARRLTSVLPPRPAGTLALLAGRPDADVVIVSHTGLEGLAGPGDALRLLPLRRPMRVDLRRIDRADVPVTADERVAWLLDEWDAVDEWVRARSD